MNYQLRNNEVMLKIIGSKLLSTSCGSTTSFNLELERLVKDGYQPHGELTAGATGSIDYMYLLMVKYEPVNYKNEYPKT